MTTQKFKRGGFIMAKAGMRRPDPKEPYGTKQGINIPKNDVQPVPEIQGKAKHTKKKANPV